MGADGGSIPRREELVKLKAKEEKADPREIERVKWSTCAISNEFLKEPIVACYLGNLYNKEVVLKHLLEKTIPSNFSHVKSLKDVRLLSLKKNPSCDESNLAHNDKARFVCPVTSIETGNNNHKFVAIECGCVISERAMRECPSTTCLVCGKSYEEKNIIKLTPDDIEIKSIKQKLTLSKGKKRRDVERNNNKEEKKRKTKEV